MVCALAPGARLASATVTTRSGARVVDLRRVNWVDPVHLVAVAAVAEQARTDGLAFRLIGPASPERARYAARMRLGDVVAAAGGTHDLPDVTVRDAGAHLVEVARLVTPSDVRRLSALVHDRVVGFDPHLAHALHQGVAEIGQNVCDHARSVGFVAAQTIPRRGELRFAVADPGVGLLETLRVRGATTDAHAIALALGGVSRTGRRGTGLPSTLHAVTRLGGQFYLASGPASVQAGPARRRTTSGAATFTGTLVEGRVPTRRPERGTMEGEHAEGGG